MKRIEVNDIKLIEKDLVEVKNKIDFERINIALFNDGFVFDLQGVLYLLGIDVAYYYDSLKSGKGKVKKEEEVEINER